jgi:hypothetical protein
MSSRQRDRIAAFMRLADEEIEVASWLVRLQDAVHELQEPLSAVAGCRP